MIGVAYRVGATGKWNATLPTRSQNAAEAEETEMRQKGFVAFALPYWLCRRLLAGQGMRTAQIIQFRDAALSRDYPIP